MGAAGAPVLRCLCMPRPVRRAFSRARGFTLIEILVVIVIIGVLVATLTLAAGGGAVRELENAAERSQRLIELACERAVLSGRDLGFAPTREGLRFGYYEREGWRPIEARGGDELRPRPWGAGVEVRAARDGDPLEVRDEPPAEPPFACLASGELTPLRLEFSRPDVAHYWRLEGAFDGRLTLRQEDDAR
jgi:general secretion pathway protein H